ncbi:uncharacterized protein C8Q71DRAFT_106415 [Rhodofomes roseus]|uniref:Uncharacterized protein n=1 Tax=Rhodofomes roseus TaxID=34475 RepID=A0ABQ8KC19_9APHY|nr:uncharacterized protein C8Q71DRAFT_106415 [Rhodofomes roseus]KAH9835149.1 hypothetical protein C8Q71DRAFT_106415 [Rhodofomes roseus]
MTLENWTLTSLDEFSSLDDAVQELCRPHVNYLEQLKAYYRQTTLEIPHVWIFGEESVTYRTCIWTETNWFNAELLRTQLRCVQEDLAFLTDEQIIGRLLSPDPAKPVNFCRSTERHYQDFYGHSVTDNEDTTVCKTHMTLCQVAQVLQYDGNSELLAEHAIAIMFDGIPGAYVRRQNLGVMGLRQGDLEDPVGPIDCAVLSVPVEPSTPRSLEQLSGLPISAVNPALLLCAKGPARWLKSAEPQSGAPNEELTATLVRIARLAETSLASLVALGTPAASSTRDDAHSEAGGTMAPTAGTRTSEAVELGDCPLMTMALVYDSERVLLVAHIPYAAQDVADGRKYLSLVFDTLPFASRCSDRSIRQFIRQRYQVALALLSVQQHVLRMAAYMERCSWPMHVGTLTPTEPSVVAELATSHGFIPEAVANPEAVCAQSTEVVQAWSQETRSPEDIRGAPQQSQVAIESSDGLREQPTGPFAVINADVEGNQ